MAAFPCPYCGHALAGNALAGNRQDEQRCSSCDGNLLIAYRYRLSSARGEVSGGVLYEAVDEIFDEQVAVLFVADPDDRGAVERFIEGNRLFAELGGGRGLVKIRELGTVGDARPCVVIDWIAAGTLDGVVRKRGPLDQATLFELIGDLLTGLSKAHRAMPSIVHGHIHPGKIGFLSGDEIVLFGFEWARQVFEQDSQLADAFVAETTPDAGADRASDLRQLAISIYFAATGEWIAEKPLARQRARVREQLGGPLGSLLDRMLAAGAEGYASAVDALIDFEDLLRGTSSWQARRRPRHQPSMDPSFASGVGPSLASLGEPSDLFAEHSFDAGEDDEDDVVEEVEDVEDLEDLEEVEEVEDLFASEALPQPARPSRPAQPARPDPFERARMAQLQQAQQAAAAPSATVNPTKIVGAVIAGMVVFGMCVADLVESEPPPPPVVREFPRPRPAEIPPIPETYEPPPMPSPEPFEPPADEPPTGPVVAPPIGLHHYTGTITGPQDRAGLELGERCEVWVEPNRGSSLNCRWYIDCGEPRRRIYGGADIGYSTCTTEDGHPISAQDEEDDAPDGAFMAVLSEQDPMIIVQDRWLLPPTRVLISIEAGGPHDGPIPDIPLARRQSQPSIETAIGLGELPQFGDGN